MINAARLCSFFVREDLADGRPDFLANGREWRTRPLWGIGYGEWTYRIPTRWAR